MLSLILQRRSKLSGHVPRYIALKPPFSFVLSATAIEDEQEENWCSLLRNGECEKQEP